VVTKLYDLEDTPSLRGTRWFAVYTLANKEAFARQELRNQGFNVFLPQRLKTLRHARRMTTRLAPIFPRYLFVQLNLRAARWRSINGTRGVASLVSFGDIPAAVPEGIMEGLIKACDNNCVFRTPHLYECGQDVRMAAGPFADVVGTFDKMDGEDAVRVLLDIMGRRVSVHAKLEALLPAA
jgi:transcription elongation factor/antiterminator RfaH